MKFGLCASTGCESAAIYAHDAYGPPGVCEDHLPKDCAFAPFLGQQQKFMAAMQRVVFVGGAGGGGKSYLGRMKFSIQLALECDRMSAAQERGERFHSRAWGIYFRRKTKDMLQVWERSKVEFPLIDSDAYFNSEAKMWTFPNCGNAKFQFSHMEHRDNRYDHKSAEFTYIFFDELTEFEREMYEYIETRLRTDDRELEPYLQICSASNPDGKHMLWVKRKFIDVAPPETVVRVETELRDGRITAYEQVFIPAKLDDNPKLMGGMYETGLINKPKHIREAILNGNWNYAAGAFLSEVWNFDLHAVEDHDPPKGSRIFRSGDWGIRNPYSIGWWYEDQDGALTLFFHIRGTQQNADVVARKVAAVERMFGLWDEDAQESKLNLSRSPLDAACFAKHGLSGSVTIAGEFKKNGVRWKESKKDRYNGAAQIVRRLSTMVPAAFEGAERPWERERPMLRFMKRCKSPLETLPVLTPDPDDANDVDTTADDHDWDMVMYACLEVPISHEPEEEDDLALPDDEPKRSRSGGGWMNGPWNR